MSIPRVSVSTQTQTEPKLLVTAAEAARRLDMSVSTLRRLVDAGEIDAIRFGEKGHVRIRVRDLEELVEREGEPRDA